VWPWQSGDNHLRHQLHEVEAGRKKGYVPSTLMTIGIKGNACVGCPALLAWLELLQF
jgi:hypothetical protein